MMKPKSLTPKPIHMYGAAARGWSVADGWAGACERELQAAARRRNGRKRRPRKKSFCDNVTRETARHQRQELAWPARPPRSRGAATAKSIRLAVRRQREEHEEA